jgi:hypothetical protein
MSEEDDVLRRLIGIFERLGFPYAIGGSLAAIQYGEPRATLGADVVADLQRADVRRLIGELPRSEFYVSEEAALEAVVTAAQFNIIHIPTAFKFDIFLPSDDLSIDQIKRARQIEIRPGVLAQVSPPEELILKKLQYYRMGESPKHLRDVAAMLQISPEEIDREYVEREAARLGLTELGMAVVRRVEEQGAGS